jgi:putative ABC transport system permease protein
VQIGLFLGFTTTTSNVIDNSHADLWVVRKGVSYIEVGAAVSEKNLYHARAVEGMAEAQKYIVAFGEWKRPDGGHENCELIGFDPESSMGGPWNLSEGDVRSLKLPDTVIVDRLYAKRLGITNVGQAVEIRNLRARVAGFTDGVRTFTTSPLVFTSYKNAKRYVGLPSDQTMFLLIKAAPGANIERIRERMQASIPGVDVWPTARFSSMTTNYWMFSTGAGVTVILAALLGLLVGAVVVAQTIYAATMDHIREYGTLKAMGATNGYIYRIIFRQAAVSAAIGYVVGIAVASLAEFASRNSGTNILLPIPVRAALFGLTLVMCLGAAMVSINKVTKIDPALVFKG